MAAGQWFPASWSSSTSAFVPCLLQINIPCTYGDWQHLDASAGLHCFYWRGTVLRISSNCWDTVSGEDRIRSILYGRYHMLRIFVRFSYLKLSFCRNWKTFLKVSVYISYIYINYNTHLTFFIFLLGWTIVELHYSLWARLYPGFTMVSIAIISPRWYTYLLFVYSVAFP